MKIEMEEDSQSMFLESMDGSVPLAWFTGTSIKVWC